MRLQLKLPAQLATGFAALPGEFFANPFAIDWQRTEELYREAYEQARAVLRPSIIDRLAPYWN